MVSSVFSKLKISMASSPEDSSGRLSQWECRPHNHLLQPTVHQPVHMWPEIHYRSESQLIQSCDFTSGFFSHSLDKKTFCIIVSKRLSRSFPATLLCGAYCLSTTETWSLQGATELPEQGPSLTLGSHLLRPIHPPSWPAWTSL